MVENRSGPGKQILKGNFGPRSLPDAWHEDLMIGIDGIMTVLGIQ